MGYLMINIYEVTDEFLEQFGLLQAIEDLESHVLKDTLDGLAGDVAQNLGSYCKNIEAQLNAMQTYELEMRKKEELMREKRMRLRDKLDRFKGYLLDKLSNANIDRLECSEFTIYVKNNPSSVAIHCEVDKIPDEYVKVKTIVTPNKLKLKNAIKNGVIIDGVELVTTKRIEMK
jgi:hypothetical protein